MSKKHICEDCGNETLIPEDNCLNCDGAQWRSLSDTESTYGAIGWGKSWERPRLRLNDSDTQAQVQRWVDGGIIDTVQMKNMLNHAKRV